MIGKGKAGQVTETHMSFVNLAPPIPPPLYARAYSKRPGISCLTEE